MPISAVSSLIALGFQQNILKASEGREEADVGWQWPSRGAGTARDIVEQVVGRDFTALKCSLHRSAISSGLPQREPSDFRRVGRVSGTQGFLRLCPSSRRSFG